jgi:predicted ATPase
MAVVAPEGTNSKDAGISMMSRFDGKRSLIGKVAPDLVGFPFGTWLAQLLKEGVRHIVLDPDQLRRPSPPGKTSGFKPDGSNLPWAVAHLEGKSPERHKEWIRHLQTALPDLTSVTTIDRPEDRHRYLSLEYRDGLKVPSWMASDGTLRLLALTLPSYLEDFEGIYLVEEPENGIHPVAIETMYQSLSSVYDAQVLLATHSPVILGITDLEDVLCFRKDDAGATGTVVGTEHPELRDWHGEVNLGTLFASGVLG